MKKLILLLIIISPLKIFSQGISSSDVIEHRDTSFFFYFKEGDSTISKGYKIEYNKLAVQKSKSGISNYILLGNGDIIYYDDKFRKLNEFYILTVNKVYNGRNE